MKKERESICPYYRLSVHLYTFDAILIFMKTKISSGYFQKLRIIHGKAPFRIHTFTHTWTRTHTHLILPPHDIPRKQIHANNTFSCTHNIDAVDQLVLGIMYWIIHTNGAESSSDCDCDCGMAVAVMVWLSLSLLLPFVVEVSREMLAFVRHDICLVADSNGVLAEGVETKCYFQQEMILLT